MKCIIVIFINTIQLKSGFLEEICREILLFQSDSAGVHPRTNCMWFQYYSIKLFNQTLEQLENYTYSKIAGN